MRSSWSLMVILGLIGLPAGFAFASAPPPTSQPATRSTVANGLDQQVEAFFRTDDPAARAGVLRAIVARPDADVAAVAAAVGRVQLWEPHASGVHTLDVAYGGDAPTRVRVRVPKGYAPARRYPLIVALHGQGGGAAGYLRYVEQILGDSVDEFIIAAPHDYKGTWFLVTETESRELVDILGVLRRRFHLDTDRIYVNGYSMGGHGAFMSAVLYSDWFAAAVPLAGTFTTPNTPETKPTLLANLAGFPMLLVWGEHDTRDRHQEETDSGGIAGLNRTLRSELPKMGIHSVEFIELAGRGHRDVVPPRDRLLHFLNLRRDHNRKDVVHWFRFPVQGRVGWLRQNRFAGDPWEGQIVVRVRPGDDVHEFARRAVRRKLGLLEGHIDGQTVRLRLQHTKEAEILLHDGLVDLDRPIIVYRGRKVVFDGRVTRKASTLLRRAYADWEFQRLPCVRIIVPGRGKAREG